MRRRVPVQLLTLPTSAARRAGKTSGKLARSQEWRQIP
jgi:hypothetical protein